MSTTSAPSALFGTEPSDMALLSLCENIPVSNETGPIPPGWYPDPSGERQWRVWNGTEWSDVTRPYGTGVMTQVPTTSFGPSELETLSALRHLTQFGILAYYAGFALLVGLIAHWPGHAHPVSARFASATLGAALGLTLIGTLSFAGCVRGLRGRWTLDALIPVVNSFAASYWMSRHLGLTGFEFRLFADALITAGFVLLCASQPWVGIALAGVAFTQLARTYLVIDRISGPSKSSSSAP
ncbi:MAG TPA: DUF2510 domain-containing protein [Acidimicrobiales bacterium]